MVGDEKKHEKWDMDAGNIKEILGAVSAEVPAMIKSILASVFSEEAGRSMGKAAAAYYKELKAGGLPEPVALKMTEEYMRTFTSIGEMLRSAGKGNWGKWGERGEDISEQIEKKIHEKLKSKKTEEEEEE
jgi:hypothetical protein